MAFEEKKILFKISPLAQPAAVFGGAFKKSHSIRKSIVLMFVTLYVLLFNSF